MQNNHPVIWKTSVVLLLCPLECFLLSSSCAHSRTVCTPSCGHTPTAVLPTLQVLADIRADKDQAIDGLSSALLILYLDSARNLPVGSTELTRGSACLTWKLLLCSATVYQLILCGSSREAQVAFAFARGYLYLIIVDFLPHCENCLSWKGE